MSKVQRREPVWGWLQKCGATYDVSEIKNPISALSGTTPIHKDSEHIFFNLPKQIDVLKDFLQKSDLQKPIVNKLSEWVKMIFSNGIYREMPPTLVLIFLERLDKYFYVWLDAPIGYLAAIENWAASNTKKWKNYGLKILNYEIYHFIGKDIAYFHGLFWPALLDQLT